MSSLLSHLKLRSEFWKIVTRNSVPLNGNRLLLVQVTSIKASHPKFSVWHAAVYPPLDFYWWKRRTQSNCRGLLLLLREEVDSAYHASVQTALHFSRIFRLEIFPVQKEIQFLRHRKWGLNCLPYAGHGSILHTCSRLGGYCLGWRIWECASQQLKTMHATVEWLAPHENKALWLFPWGSSSRIPWQLPSWSNLLQPLLLLKYLSTAASGKT